MALCESSSSSIGATNGTTAMHSNSNQHHHQLHNHSNNETMITSYLEPDCDAIPIFSEQFLEHNRQREAELRLLRKNTSDLEEQNATLSKHIETMNAAIEQLESEFIQQRTSQALAGQRLTRMRQLLYSALADTVLPGTSQLPTLPDIDSWVMQLQDAITHLPRSDPQVLEIQAKISSVLTKLDL